MKTGRNEINCVDATTEKRLLVLPRHARHATKSDPSDCVIARCLKQDHSAEKVHILRNTAYVTKDGKTTRYILSTQTKLAICQFDTTGRWPIPGDGVHIVLRPPVGVRSLANLRSAKFKADRRKSYLKRKSQPKRLYKKTDGISAEAIRSGVGYAVD